MPKWVPGRYASPWGEVLPMNKKAQKKAVFKTIGVP